MKLPPPGQRTPLFGGVAVLLVALMAISAFLPIAGCPNCQGRGAVTHEVNRAWIRSHPLTLFGSISSSLGMETCVRCGGRGRVTPMGAWAQ